MKYIIWVHHESDCIGIDPEDAFIKMNSMEVDELDSHEDPRIAILIAESFAQQLNYTFDPESFKP